MNKLEVVGRVAKNVGHAIDRFRRGVRLVADEETGLVVEVPRDLDESDAIDFASSAAFTELIQRVEQQKKP